MLLEQIMEIRKELQENLKPERYEHTLSVSFTCMNLAMRYGASLEQAELAGLLHDCAKRYSGKELISKCMEHQIPVTKEQCAASAILHAPYGAWMAEHHFGIKDPEVLKAIACHSTGKPEMGLLDKILYIADYIEPRRTKAPNLDKIRAMAYTDLDEALLVIMEATLRYLQQTGAPVDPASEAAYGYYLAEKQRERGV